VKIAVVGAGGVGGFFGAKLARGGADVTFIARGATLQALRERGIRVQSIEGDFDLSEVRAQTPAGAGGPFDAVLMAVKAWQIEEAAGQIKPLLHAKSVVVPLENGIEAPDQLRRIVGSEHAAGGLCAIVSYVVEPGLIKHAAFDPMVMFGELDNRKSERLEHLREAFVKAGVKAEIPPDIHRSMWTKFVFITPMSGVGAVTRVPVGIWRATPESRHMAQQAVEEVARLATARGVHLDEAVVASTMQRYDALAAESTASLQRDVMHGRPSELEAQVGAVVRLGGPARVPTPVHDFLYAALLPLERQARAIP
jgi:2-dehydropantoate 2-reductase